MLIIILIIFKECWFCSAPSICISTMRSHMCQVRSCSMLCACGRNGLYHKPFVSNGVFAENRKQKTAWPHQLNMPLMLLGSYSGLWCLFGWSASPSVLPPSPHIQYDLYVHRVLVLTGSGLTLITPTRFGMWIWVGSCPFYSFAVWLGSACVCLCVCGCSRLLGSRGVAEQMSHCMHICVLSKLIVTCKWLQNCIHAV